MSSVARMQVQTEVASETEIELIQVSARKIIVIADGTMATPTVINAGEQFYVNLIPMKGLKGFVAHYKGESFFVESHEFKALYC